MRTNQLWNFVGIALMLSFILGILIHFTTIITSFGLVVENTAGQREVVSVGRAFTEVFVSSMVAFCTFLINFYIIRPFDSSVKIRPTRMLVAILVTVLAVTLLSDLFFAIKHLIDGGTFQVRFNLLYSFRDLFTAVTVISGIYIIKKVYDGQTVKIENEILKNEKLMGQYESLKNQISPHFMFNSLTALRELIDQDPNNAKIYISHLSSVLRYTLSSLDIPTKCLCDEMEVAESYFHLVKIRFGSSLVVDTFIDDRFRNYRLPSLAILTLVENAIKHNEISRKNPFNIKIETTGNCTLTVSNPVRERKSKEYSTGIGLSNLSKQYQYLAKKEIYISKGNNEFRVELPLLNPSDHESAYC